MKHKSLIVASLLLCLGVVTGGMTMMTLCFRRILNRSSLCPLMKPKASRWH